MGLYGIVVVTAAPVGTTAGTAYPGVSYSADIPLLLSEIDPVQTAAVSTAVSTAGFDEATVWSGQPGGCGNPGTANAGNCYPPAVNYSPLYFLVNGVGFDKTNTAATPSLFATAPATGVTGNVLVRLVNAGLRMHIPSIVGSVTTPAIVGGGAAGTTAAAGFSLVAEDGNPLPGVSRIQSEVFLAPGKTYDVMIDAPALGGTALPIFDRQGSLSANANSRDAGMLAYISVNAAALPAAASLAAAAANPDVYNSVIVGRAFSVTDAGKGLLGNDVNVSGVALVGVVPGLPLHANGTFSYVGSPIIFTYCANGTVTGAICSSGITATVTLGAATIEAGGISCTVPTFTSTVATALTVKPPGVLASCTDAAGYPLQVTAAASSNGTAAADPNGGFTITGASPGAGILTFTVQKSQGTPLAPQSANLVFPPGNSLAISVVDGIDKTTAVADYRWIIEEDRTFYVDPNCQANPLPAGCPTVTTQGAPAVFGTNFHTSYMPVVAQGCVGPAGTAVSCEAGQTVLDTGLGGFNTTIFALVGGTGDSAGQLTYDEFGQPLSNALSGTIDPQTGKDACPIVADPFTGSDGPIRPTAITGVIPVCPNYEADGVTLSPLGGQAVVAGFPPGRYGIVATPAADRIARGEEWLQTNTLDGGKDLEAFLKNNEPTYFQEFCPAGFHVSMGFANPKFINDWRTAGQGQGSGTSVTLGPAPESTSCPYTVSGMVTGVHMSRPSDERLYGSGSRDSFGYTQCYVSLASPDGVEISFAKCRDDGSFTLTGIPAGDWRVTIFDQWNDQIVDGITTPVRVGAASVNMGEIGVHGWKNNLYTRTFFDTNGDGISNVDGQGNPTEPGLALVPTNIRYRDGSLSNLNSTDLGGNAGFNEVFPIFNWYVMETDSTRYKNTGIHVINDADWEFVAYKRA